MFYDVFRDVVYDMVLWWQISRVYLAEVITVVVVVVVVAAVD